MHHYVQHIFEAWSKTLGEELEAQWVFACEIDSEKQKFLEEQFDLDIIFEEIMHLSSQREECGHWGLSLCPLRGLRVRI
eukprot:8048519-Heterocapsa_arctica.AAC.1